MQQRVLVAGATGYLGHHVVKEFKRQGYWVRAMTETHVGLERINEYVDDAVVANVTEPDSLRGICSGIDVVFSSVGITRRFGGLTYMDVDYQGNLNLLEEARRCNVQKFVYVSVLNADAMRELKIMQAKLAFADALRQSGLKAIIIKPNGFFSDMRDFLKMAQQGRGYVFSDGEFRINPIHGQDLAKVCVEAAQGDSQEIEVGGPDVFTHNEILAMAFDVAGKPEKVTHIPMWMRRVALSGARNLTPLKTYGPLEFFMTVLARDMVAPCHGEHHLEAFFAQAGTEVQD